MLFWLKVCALYDFQDTMRRVNCPDCGIKVEAVPWAIGKNHLVTTYAWFLVSWAKRMSWKDVSRSFHISWESVYRSVKMAVTWGLAHRNLDGIKAIGIDEIAWRKGKDKFMTLVYQIDSGRKRLLFTGENRTKATLEKWLLRKSVCEMKTLAAVKK
jgi:transposase